MSDAPIHEQGYVAGVTVVHIEDLRVARGMTRRPQSSCAHTSLVYDAQERRVWCRNCETEVEPFDAFKLLVERAHAHQRRLRERETAVSEAERFQLRSRAARVMDEAWRKRSMVPACPHCRRGILPEDVARGVSLVGTEFAAMQNMRPEDGGNDGTP